MKYTNNPEFIKFFQDSLDKNSLYTILTFQKGTQSEKNGYNKCSVAIAYNHRYCKIERFLIIYEYPYDIKPNDTQLNTFIHTPLKDSIELSLQNFISDGKFSKNFLTYFIFYLIYAKHARSEFNYAVKDIRAIDYLHKNDKESLEELIESDYLFKDFNHDDKSIINIPKKYYNIGYNKSISNHYANMVELKPYSNSELSPALIYVRQILNGKTFKDNIKLEQQIKEVNTYLLNKGKAYIQKANDKEYAEIFDVNPRKR